MHRLSCAQLFLFISLWLFALLYSANAKITILKGNVTQSTYPTSDYFLRRQPYYRYNGVVIPWRFQLNTSDPNIQFMAKMSLEYPDFAIAIDGTDLFGAQCTTKQQMNKAIDDLSRQLSEAKLPLIRFLLLLVMKIATGQHLNFRYIAEEGQSALIILMMLYACGRIIMLIKLKMLNYDILFAVFCITIVYCCSVLYHLVNRVELFKSQCSITTLLFSKKAVISFRCVVAFDFIVNAFAYIYTIICVHYMPFFKEKKYLNVLDAARYIKLILPVLDVLIFAGFTIWFLLLSHKLRKHPKGRIRFTYLAIFTALALSTYVIYLVQSAMHWKYKATLKNNLLAIIDAFFDVAYTIRAFIFLTAIGIRWPRVEKSTDGHTPFNK
ncbi:hypothetical protein BDF19DRAFT_446336 [Syncephalis fuscata]|nr:hypothetical protein BDF19DRAFT_446336 [Syncephalis fuscata]